MPVAASLDETPDDDVGIEAGRLLFAQTCDFVAGAAEVEQFPETDLPEIAFAGRSNVGKSSLINALTGRKSLARTSNTPGRTQEINYFRLGPADGNNLLMVDLPGYGFAQAPKETVARWTRLVTGYLKGRPNLRRVFLLIDARHGPKAVDEEIMRDLDVAAVSYQAVLTKADKISQAELEACIEATRQTLRKHPASHPEIIATSSAKNTGLDILRSTIAKLAAGL
jgi:GTP-binding protein